MNGAENEPASPSLRALRLTGAQTFLSEGWQWVALPADSVRTPIELAAQLVAKGSVFAAAPVPGTVAMVQAGGDGAIDALDHWYRLPFRLPEGEHRRYLVLEGLATLAEVWLDGAALIESENMFHAHSRDVSAQLALGDAHELLIRFRALAPVLKQRRPRGRWPSRFIAEKNLRFFRTSLLGYMHGWYPILPPVGPWRTVSLVEPEAIVFQRLRLRPRLEGTVGVLAIEAECEMPVGDVSATVILGEGHSLRLKAITLTDGRLRFSGELRVPDVAPWWPHTHGTPTLHPVRLSVQTGDRVFESSLRPVGFRRLEVERGVDGQGFGLRINGVRLFCRGACWAPLDPESVHVTPERYRLALEQAVFGGMNMLRVGGTMAYESDAFYDLCDELGILLWQELMFANLDYPAGDLDFFDSCKEEVLQLFERIGGRSCLAVVCGGSEVAQQAAMMGLPREQWRSPLFDELFPQLCVAEQIDAAYVPSSPSGGAMPFHVNAGVGHYYGTGAYLRPLSDARVAGVRFASECLAFANVPESESLARWLGRESAMWALDPRFKTAVPRDPGAAWDFADVTDHYVHLLFGAPVAELRVADPVKYLDLCRLASGTVIETVLQIFRRAESGCLGALVWLFQDPRPGAGWGLVDSDGRAKAAYFFFKRACAPQSVWISDEGVNGLLIYADNENDHPLEGTLTVTLFQSNGVVVDQAQSAILVGARSQVSWNVEALLGHFVDASYAYRFGPPGHSVVHVRLDPAGGPASVVEAFHQIVPPGANAKELEARDDLQLVARARREGTIYLLELSAAQLALGVAIDVPGYRPADNYFSIAPGRTRTVRLWPDATVNAPPTGTVRAVNTLALTAIVFETQ